MRRVPRIPYRERRLLNRILGRIGGEESCEHPGNSRSVNSLTRKSSLRAATETPGRVTLVAIKARIQLSYFPGEVGRVQLQDGDARTHCLYRYFRR